MFFSDVLPNSLFINQSNFLFVFCGKRKKYLPFLYRRIVFLYKESKICHTVLNNAQEKYQDFEITIIPHEDRKNSQENWFEGHKDQLTISID